MALTQSAVVVPSWEDEVVPALRKRLESESRTLARRMSAISLSSVEEPSPRSSYASYVEKNTRPSTTQSPTVMPGIQTIYQQQQPSGRPSLSDRSMAMPTGIQNNNINYNIGNRTANGLPPFQRSRTYSSPYGNGHVPNGVSKMSISSKSGDPSRSLSPRPIDVKPTRIPKATSSRPPTSTNTSPYPTSSPASHVTASQPAPSSSTSSTAELSSFPSYSAATRNANANYGGSSNGIGLLNEHPPFPTQSTMNSSYENDSPRPSMDSEERPFEHWYRGEVSRNGGVGELRVGRRQEMLDIANYGHLIGNKKTTSPTQTPAEEVSSRYYRNRKRAGSIAGITNKERERGSVYLDEHHANQVGRVLDEHPLTDLEGEGEEGSDINSLSDSRNQQNMVAYAYIPGETDDWVTRNSRTHEEEEKEEDMEMGRSTTPTPSSMPLRPSSRQQALPTRIPGYASRRSSESRSTTTTSPHPHSNSHSNSNSIQLSNSTMSRYVDFGAASSSTSATPSPSSVQASTSKQTVQRRGVSPSPVPSHTPKKPTPGKAATLAKIAGKKKEEAASLNSNNRSSLAQYPTPDGDEGDMADAIPSWTQPVPREGNWDDVVLPVVAKKKGLEKYYEDANGSPQPKKDMGIVEPAPGTFGFDHSKYRPSRNNNVESIAMDEFGRPAPSGNNDDAEQPPNGLAQPTSSSSLHDDTPLPVRQQQGKAPFSHHQTKPSTGSAAPFSSYAPNRVEMLVKSGLGKDDADVEAQQQNVEKVEKGGCCGCVVM